MANYNFYDIQKEPMVNRYNKITEIIGSHEWETFIMEPSYAHLNEIRKIKPPVLTCPRVFVSHRQIDENYGKRIAWLAYDEKFEFWLDVLDPGLQMLPNLKNISEDQKLLITAGIVEMAIINCTHVIAVITSNTVGTMWVPYEYGRITEIPTKCGRAAAWKHPKLTYSPEYLLLGNNPNSEEKIRKWFSKELAAWQDGQNERYNKRECKVSWEGEVPAELPSADN